MCGRAPWAGVPVLALALFLGCDRGDPGGAASDRAGGGSASAQDARTAVPPPGPAPLQPPEIIVNRTNLDVGRNRVAIGTPGLEEAALAALQGGASVVGASVDVVAMRSAVPSSVGATLGALRRAGAARARVKSETRDGSTQSLPVAFAQTVPDCTAVAWIGRGGGIDVWPAGGGSPKHVARGLAGPDLTLATDALHDATSNCESQEIVVGADDAMTWGLVFDLTMEALHQTWTRTSAALVTVGAIPGRKLAFVRPK